MKLKNYHELTGMEIDTLQEISNIGTGNAATALSEMLGSPVRITLPEVRVMGYNEAIEWIGGPEAITAGVLAQLGGEINGVILAVQQLEFVNLVLSKMLDESVENFEQLKEMEVSTLTEVGNIMVSNFINALSGLADLTISMSVPSFAVDMQGAILTVLMAAYGGQSNYVLTMGGNLSYENMEVPCRILLSPDIMSLNLLLRKLGVLDE